MSQSVSIQISCPACSHVQDFAAFQSLNVTLDTHLKTKLLDGSLNRFTCGKCNASAEIVYPMLYHDMDKKLLVWLMPDNEEPGDAPQGLPSVESLGADGLGYTLRRVTTKNALIEKIFIFDHHLDDRAVECMKLILLSQMPEERQRPGMKLLFTRLTNESGEERLEFTVLAQNDPPQGLGVARDPIYVGCRSQIVAEHPQPPGWAVVDDAYATELFKLSSPPEAN